MNTITLQTHQPSLNSLLGQWFVSGWKLFIKAPFTIFACMLATVIIAGLFQALPAPTGIILSKWVGAILAAVMWPVVDQIATSGKFSFKHLANYRGYKALPILACILMLPFAFQLLVATLMMGNTGISLLLFGELVNVNVLQIASIFASGAPVIVLTMFMPACLLLGGDSIKHSVIRGIKMVANAWQAMLVLLVINTAVLFLAPYTLLLSALLLSPLLVCINYQAYVYLRAYQKDNE